jgi:hypothetical protein
MDVQPPRRFTCVNDSVPEETTRLLREACASRGVTYDEVAARGFDFDPARRLTTGDLLYRPAVSMASIRVEQFLYVDGVATFYRDPDGISFTSIAPLELLARAGLPVPPTIPCATRHRQTVRTFVERLGGPPIVAKMGGEGGVGVLLLESLPAIFSFVDYAVSNGAAPLLSPYYPRAQHQRVVVVGDRAVAAYDNPLQRDDFRSYASTDPADYTADVDPLLADLAVRAVQAFRLEHGGVDLLQDEAGGWHVLEANFPCYFAQAQVVAGIDVAGAMIEWLLAKASGRS